MKNLITLLLFLFASVLTVEAEDASEDLFANPEPDSSVDGTQKVPLDTFSKQSIRFFESLEASGYFVTGYNADGKLISTPVNALTFGFGSDARLDRSTRGYASFELSYPKPSDSSEFLYNPYEPPLTVAAPADLVFSSIEVKELFLDYSLGDLAIVRVGRQSATWGQGRLFNPADLVTGIGRGMGAKVSAALGPVAVTGVAIKNDDFYYPEKSDLKPTKENGKVASFETLGLALQTDYSSPWFTLGASGFSQEAVGQKASAYVKTSLWGADLFVEGLAEWGLNDEQSLTGLAGFYRDFGDQGKWLKVQAEYLVSGRGNEGTFRVVNSEDLGWKDQTIGIAATSDLLKFVDLKPSFLWLHSVTDGSGQLVVGLISTALNHVSLTAAVARIYGTPESRYITKNPDPENRSLFLTLKLTAQFEIKN